jgi:aminoglycoside phosphotransferase (APT) family kinase protein
VNIEDPQALAGYLHSRARLPRGEIPRLTVLSGGVSNRTVLLRREGGEAWVLKQALPKLRVAVEWMCPPARAHREAIAMRWLGTVLPPGTIPRLLFEDEAEHLIVMEAAPEPHANWKAMLLEGAVEERHVTAFGELLGRIHRAGFAEQLRLDPGFADRSFFEALRLEPYYTHSAGQVPEAAVFLRHLAEETRTLRLTVVHGDYSPKNVLVHDGGLVLLDHEVAHFGDPAFDLGFALTHFLSKAHHVVAARARFAGAAHAFWSEYRRAMGLIRWGEDWSLFQGRVVRHALGCLLARVAGRSPLEYLTVAERAKQLQAVTALMSEPPRRVPELIDAFLERIEVPIPSGSTLGAHAKTPRRQADRE